MYFFSRLKISLYWAFLVAIFTGTVFVAYFTYVENYSSFELHRFILYFIQRQLIIYIFRAFIGALIFTSIWSFFPQFEGFTLASLLVLLIMVPMAIYANQQLLPGIREAKSIIGNACIVLVTGISVLLLYFKLARDWHIFQHFYSTKLFILIGLLFLTVNGFYFKQPAYSKLEKAPESFNRQFKNLFATTSFGISDESRLDEQLFLSYFSQRRDSVVAEVRARLYRLYPDTAEVIKWANDDLARKFTLWDVTKQLPETIDWYDNPTDDDIWLYALNEFEWMWDIMAAYIMTKDEKYAADFDKIMQNFFDQISLIQWKDERDPVWRLIGVGLRLSDSWVDAFYVFLNSPSVSNDVKIKMLSYIHDQAQFLYFFRSPRRNHLIQESFGLMKVGIMFPEFKMAKEWLNMSVYRLDRGMKMDVYPDGGYTEVSTFYHRYVVRLFDEIVNYAEKHDVHLTDDFYKRFEKMYAFMMYTAWPDGRMPAVNDGFHAKKLQPLFHKPAKRFHREDFEYFATDGASGKRPDTTSVAFPYSGLYVMRSDWSPDARYSIFDGGLFGSAHGHEDKLNFEIVAYGEPFIVEAGTFTYVYNKWHKYFESSFAHNTIVVDGSSQLRQPDQKHWDSQPQKKLPNVWFSNAYIDYVQSTYDKGYGNHKESISHDVKHTRRLLFVKPDYWILWDVLIGAGEHKYDQLFHFVPGEIEISESNKSVQTKNEKSANFMIYPVQTENLSVKIEEGELHPIQGWYSPKYGEKVEAPVVIYSKSGKTPTVFLDVLFPKKESEDGILQISKKRVSINGKIVDESVGISLVINHANWTDFVLIGLGNNEIKKSNGIETNKNFLLIRRNDKGQVLKKVEMNFQ